MQFLRGLVRTAIGPEVPIPVAACKTIQTLPSAVPVYGYVELLISASRQVPLLDSMPWCDQEYDVAASASTPRTDLQRNRCW